MTSGAGLPAELGQAREHFLQLVGELRPGLHRYCARLVGSVVDGEDIVQDALAKAFYALSMASESPPLRPWLFRIAHNTAIDFLRRHEQARVERRADFEDTAAEPEDAVDPSVVRASLSSFLELPVRQRSAVILKDVLGHSLAEVADTMGATIPAVKAALVRGRAALRAQSPAEARPRAAVDPVERGRLDRYVAAFNARDWDGLRSLMSEECRLELVSRAVRRGAGVREYVSRYAAGSQLRMAVGAVEGRPALLVFRAGESRPDYFILIDWSGDRVSFIRDYRYAGYVAAEAELELELEPSPERA